MEKSTNFNFKRAITSKICTPELHFLCSAYHLKNALHLYSFMKISEFVFELHRAYKYISISKCQNYKNILSTNLLAFCLLSHVALHLC